MFSIKCIDHIVLRVRDVDSMVSFYCETLGCKIENIQKEIELTQLRAGDSIIDLLKVEDNAASTNRNLDHFCLRIDPFNYDSLKKYFQSKGIEIYKFGERNGAQGIGPSFYLKDPDGNEIELKQGLPNV
jgi:glyoxylase I family protein